MGSNSVIRGSLDLDPQRSTRGYTEETPCKDLVEDSHLQAEPPNTMIWDFLPKNYKKLFELPRLRDLDLVG